MIDTIKIIDNFEGNEKELKNIALTVYEICCQGFDDDFHDNAQSMLDCDYDFLTEDQYNKVMYEYIEELIENDGEFECENFGTTCPICEDMMCLGYKECKHNNVCKKYL